MRVLSTLVRGLEMPVNEFPCSARGSCPIFVSHLVPVVLLVYLFTAQHVQQNCTVL